MTNKKIKSKLKNIPQHVAIIPDGNRRWAKMHNWDVSKGHEEGVKVLRSILRVSCDLGIPYFSFWGSSKNNLLKRSKVEVQFLYHLYQKHFTELTKNEEIHKNMVKINVLGEWKDIVPLKVQESILKAIDATKHYNKFNLTFFIGYNGTDEMRIAITEIVRKCRADPKLEVTDDLIKKNLFTHELPAVDLLIRTGGEPHMSVGFMMWDLADAQLFFSEKLWPDFTPNDFCEAIENFAMRKRRFGR